MDDNPFTVTLPSNSNMGAYPTNRGSKYIVKLSSPINFTSTTLNDDVSWEAALTGLQYTNRFYDVRDTVVLRIAVEFPNITAIVTSEKSQAGLIQFSSAFTTTNIASYAPLDKRILTTFVKASGSTDTSFIVYGKITIPAGHYKDPSAVYNLIVDEFNKLYSGPRYNTHISASIKGADGTLQFSLEPATNKLHMFTDKPSIVNTLGFTAKADATTEPTFYKLLTVGTKTPRFDVVQSLYVYCDIIKPQHVGDTLAPLLEILPIQGMPGQRIHFGVNPLTYLPVNRTYIETITIDICDEYGNYVIFPDDVENVVCRLRFRRIKRNALML